MLTPLSRRDWPRFFDRLSAALAGRAVDVYAAGLDGEPHAEWVRLSSLSYDAAGNELALVLDHADSVELVQADGRRDFIVLRHALEVLA